MKSISKRLLIAVSAIGMLAATCVWITDVATRALRPGNVILTGNTPSKLYEAQFVARANPQQTMHVVVGLKLRNEGELDKLIQAQSKPGTPEFRQFLTPAQFLQRFGPTQSDVDTAKAYFVSQGLTVVQVTANNMLIVLEGSTATVEKAFSVHVNTYSLQGMAGMPSGTFTSNDQDPAIPASLANIVLSVSGLNDFSAYQSKLIKNPHAATTQPSVPVGYTPADIATAYDFPNINNASGRTFCSGRGCTIAVATAYGYLQSDIDAYWKQWGVRRTGAIVNVPVNGYWTKTNDETTLDLETIGAQAPGADIIMYIGADPQFKTFTLIFNQIVTDNKADVVSCSWGSCEDNEGKAQMQTESAVLKQAAAQGIAIFSSSGDDGAYDCGGKKPQYSVDYPSADPNVTAVGGTMLFTVDSKRLFESAWSSSGGGVSSYWARPVWQVGTGVPKGDKRVSADVSMDADPYTGYAVYVDGRWQEFGGTSVSTPEWASVWTLATQAAGGRLGPAAPTIWWIANSPIYPSLFEDITDGDNGAGKGPGYPAGVGFDHPTGWGVPKATALVRWLGGDDIYIGASVRCAKRNVTSQTQPVPPKVAAPK